LAGSYPTGEEAVLATRVMETIHQSARNNGALINVWAAHNGADNRSGTRTAANAQRRLLALVFIGYT